MGCPPMSIGSPHSEASLGDKPGDEAGRGAHCGPWAGCWRQSVGQHEAGGDQPPDVSSGPNSGEGGAGRAGRDLAASGQGGGAVTSLCACATV